MDLLWIFHSEELAQTEHAVAVRNYDLHIDP